MAITIKLTTEAGAAAGVAFKNDYDAYFSDFTTNGFPYMLGGESNFDGDQIVLLDETEANPRDTKSIVLDGKDFFYHFNGHDLSGTLTTVRLATLGDSYNPDNKSFTIENDHIAKISTSIEISGLSISNPPGVEDGAFDQVVAGLMGGAPGSGGTSDPTLLSKYVWAEAHNVVGSEGGDAYTGTAFNDTVNGNGGNDTLDGGAGTDVVRGGLGDDVFFIDMASDRIIELANQGKDLVNASSSYVLDAEIERLVLTGSGHTTGTGNASANAITGNSGNNTLNGGAGADTAAGGLGNDTFIIDVAADRITEFVDQGVDTVRSAISHTLAANVERLVLTGAANVTGVGNAQANAVTGNSGNNTLNGGIGGDTLAGGQGNDVYVADSAADRVSELTNQGTDHLRSSVSVALSANVEILTLTGADDLSGVGNTGNNTITGNAGSNTLNGGAGLDALAGGLGADTIYGGGGSFADRLSGGGDPDVFQFLTLADSTVAPDARDLILDFGGDDLIQLSSIDANSKIGGNQAFSFIESAQFSKAAGELRFVATASGTTAVGDVNGDALADFAIGLKGTIALNADDFIL